MEKRSFKEKLEIIRNIIRESLLGNAAIIALIYAASHSLPVNAFPDYLVISLLSIAAGIVVLWLFSIIYIRSRHRCIMVIFNYLYLFL